MEKTKKRIFDIIQIGHRSDAPSRIFDIVIVGAILLNIALIFFETFEQSANYHDTLKKIEFVTILIFLTEYILRIWTATYLYPNVEKWKAKWKFMFSFYGIVDLLTILPFFLPYVFPNGAVAFRMLRVVRIFHLFRINTHYDAFNVITDVLKEKRDQLISSIFLILVLMLASSLCMYGLEHEAQPEHFSNAFSGIWWSVSTLLTVGYGDIYPITVGGKLMAIVIAFLGVGMVAIPTGIISAGFVEYYTKMKVGAYSQYDADIITLDITEGHPFVGLTGSQIDLPQGLYLAAILRGKEVYLPQSNCLLQTGDSLLLGTASVRRMESRLEELTLEEGHSWIGKAVKELDISRHTFLIMIKRNRKNIEPKESTRLKENDVVLLFHKD